MSAWLQIKHGLRSLLDRDAADRDIDDETRHYLDEMKADLEGKGVSPDAAKRAARLHVGTPVGVREQVRESGWENRIADALADLSLACRRLVRSPAFSLAAGGTLALAIGATAAMFVLVDGVLWRPLPYPSSGQLVSMAHTAPGINIESLRMSPSLYFTYRDESRVFDGIALWNGNHATVTGAGDAQQVPTLYVTHEFLRVLGVQPKIGRGFTAEDDDWRGERTVVLADGYWRQLFGGSPAALGRSIVVNGSPHKVIGVLPPGFEFMDEKVALLVPKRLRRDEVRLISFGDDGVGRLKPGVTLEQANADLARCLPMAAAKFPLNRGFAANAFIDARIAPALVALKDQLVGNAGRTLWLAMGAAGVLLLIACANVSNLMLVRADGRQAEFAVRSALGAGRGRIAREVLLEALVLAATGGVAGLALCVAGVHVLSSSGMYRLPRLGSIVVDGRAYAFIAALSTCAGVFLGLFPGWKYARPQVLDRALAGSNMWASGSRERQRTRATLVTVQVALAMVLLVGAGLMFRSIQALRAVDPGFTRPWEVQAARVSIPEAQMRDSMQVFAAQESILRKFAAIPGVSSVSITTSPPMEGGSSNPVYAADHEYQVGRLPPVRYTRSVSPGFVASIGGRLVAGRDFEWSEMHSAAAVVMVSENLARELWGTPRAALGKRVRRSLNHPWREVVGVVGDLRDDGMQRDAPTIVYWPLVVSTGDGGVQVPRNVDFLIRSPRVGSDAFVEELRRALAAVNPNLPLANLRTLQSNYDRSLARTTFSLVILALAGAMALLLGVVGIYGVTAYSVSRRTREIGIRIALGCQRQAVVRLFVREGILLACAGAGCGLLAALAMTQVMSSLLFGVSPIDPVTFGSVLAGLVATAIVASWMPARRAASVDPIHSLRSQ